MNKAINLELHFFLISILWGVILLLSYDILRIIRRVIRHNSLIIATQDLIFWVVSSVFIFAMMYQQNDGIIRGFSIMGMLIGMVLYHYMVSEFLVKSITGLILLLLSPLKFVLRQMVRFSRYIIIKGKKILQFILLRLKKLSKSVKITLNKKKIIRDEKRKVRLDKKLQQKEKKEAEKTKKKEQIKQLKQKKIEQHNKKSIENKKIKKNNSNNVKNSKKIKNKQMNRKTSQLTNHKKEQRSEQSKKIQSQRMPNNNSQNTNSIARNSSRSTNIKRNKLDRE